MNITIPPHPSKTVQSAEITIQLDKEYTLLLRKHINGVARHEAEYLSPEGVDESVKQLVIQTVINYCDREGVW